MDNTKQPAMSATNTLYDDLKTIVKKSKQEIAVGVNATMSMMYWQIGRRINNEVLDNKRAEYGKQILHSLSLQLTQEYGKGWGEKQLRHCLRIAEIFEDEKIVYAVSRQLSWTHLRSIIYVEDPLKREFYMEMCKMEKWSTRTLQDRINSMLFERTAISKKPDETIKGDLRQLKNEAKLSPDLIFRDPYFLNFLGLSDNYSEKDLESAILAELQQFIIEIGSDFAFLARQKRITIDNDDYYIDLLFYHNNQLQVINQYATDTGKRTNRM